MNTVYRDAKIVVVGAGFAGLAAAATLIKAGFQDVKIIEAKDRVGGRVCSTKPFTENIIELGANWIHGQDGNPLYQIAKEQDLLVETITASKVMCLPHSVTPRDYFFMDGGKQLSTGSVDQLHQKMDQKYLNGVKEVNAQMRQLPLYMKCLHLRLVTTLLLKEAFLTPLVLGVIKQF